MSNYRKCQTCWGKNTVDHATCNGTGSIRDDICNGTGIIVEDGVERTHQYCQGLGTIGDPECGGTGQSKCPGENGVECEDGWIAY